MTYRDRSRLSGYRSQPVSNRTSLYLSSDFNVGVTEDLTDFDRQFKKLLERTETFTNRVERLQNTSSYLKSGFRGVGSSLTRLRGERDVIGNSYRSLEHRIFNEDDQTTEEEWKRLLDGGILIEKAVELVRQRYRFPKPIYEYSPESRSPHPYEIAPGTILLPNPKSPRDREGRRIRDKGSEIADHVRRSVIPTKDSTPPPEPIKPKYDITSAKNDVTKAKNDVTKAKNDVTVAPATATLRSERSAPCAKRIKKSDRAEKSKSLTSLSSLREQDEDDDPPYEKPSLRARLMKQKSDEQKPIIIDPKRTSELKKRTESVAAASTETPPSEGTGSGSDTTRTSKAIEDRRKSIRTLLQSDSLKSSDKEDTATTKSPSDDKRTTASDKSSAKSSDVDTRPSKSPEPTTTTRDDKRYSSTSKSTTSETEKKSSKDSHQQSTIAVSDASKKSADDSYFTTSSSLRNTHSQSTQSLYSSSYRTRSERLADSERERKSDERERKSDERERKSDRYNTYSTDSPRSFRSENLFDRKDKENDSSINNDDDDDNSKDVNRRPSLFKTLKNAASRSKKRPPSSIWETAQDGTKNYLLSPDVAEESSSPVTRRKSNDHLMYTNAELIRMAQEDLQKGKGGRTIEESLTPTTKKKPLSASSFHEYNPDRRVPLKERLKNKMSETSTSTDDDSSSVTSSVTSQRSTTVTRKSTSEQIQDKIKADEKEGDSLRSRFLRRFRLGSDENANSEEPPKETAPPKKDRRGRKKSSHDEDSLAMIRKKKQQEEDKKREAAKKEAPISEKGEEESANETPLPSTKSKYESTKEQDASTYDTYSNRAMKMKMEHRLESIDIEYEKNKVATTSLADIIKKEEENVGVDMSKYNAYSFRSRQRLKDMEEDNKRSSSRDRREDREKEKSTKNDKLEKQKSTEGGSKTDTNRSRSMSEMSERSDSRSSEKREEKKEEKKEEPDLKTRVLMRRKEREKEKEREREREKEKQQERERKKNERKEREEKEKKEEKEKRDAKEAERKKKEAEEKKKKEECRVDNKSVMSIRERAHHKEKEKEKDKLKGPEPIFTSYDLPSPKGIARRINHVYSFDKKKEETEKQNVTKHNLQDLQRKSLFVEEEIIRPGEERKLETKNPRHHPQGDEIIEEVIPHAQVEDPTIKDDFFKVLLQREISEEEVVEVEEVVKEESTLDNLFDQLNQLQSVRSSVVSNGDRSSVSSVGSENNEVFASSGVINRNSSSSDLFSKIEKANNKLYSGLLNLTVAIKHEDSDTVHESDDNNNNSNNNNKSTRDSGTITLQDLKVEGSKGKSDSVGSSSNKRINAGPPTKDVVVLKELVVVTKQEEFSPPNTDGSSSKEDDEKFNHSPFKLQRTNKIDDNSPVAGRKSKTESFDKAVDETKEEVNKMLSNCNSIDKISNDLAQRTFAPGATKSTEDLSANTEVPDRSENESPTRKRSSYLEKRSSHKKFFETGLSTSCEDIRNNSVESNKSSKENLSNIKEGMAMVPKMPSMDDKIEVIEVITACSVESLVLDEIVDTVEENLTLDALEIKIPAIGDVEIDSEKTPTNADDELTAPPALIASRSFDDDHIATEREEVNKKDRLAAMRSTQSVEVKSLEEIRSRLDEIKCSSNNASLVQVNTVVAETKTPTELKSLDQIKNRLEEIKARKAQLKLLEMGKAGGKSGASTPGALSDASSQADHKTETIKKEEVNGDDVTPLSPVRQIKLSDNFLEESDANTNHSDHNGDNVFDENSKNNGHTTNDAIKESVNNLMSNDVENSNNSIKNSNNKIAPQKTEEKILENKRIDDSLLRTTIHSEGKMNGKHGGMTNGLSLKTHLNVEHDGGELSSASLSPMADDESCLSPPTTTMDEEALQNNSDTNNNVENNNSDSQQKVPKKFVFPRQMSIVDYRRKRIEKQSSDPSVLLTDDDLGDNDAVENDGQQKYDTDTQKGHKSASVADVSNGSDASDDCRVRKKYYRHNKKEITKTSNENSRRSFRSTSASDDSDEDVSMVDHLANRFLQRTRNSNSSSRSLGDLDTNDILRHNSDSMSSRHRSHSQKLK